MTGGRRHVALPRALGDLFAVGQVLDGKSHVENYPGNVTASNVP
jgi:hypothetical protein